MRYSAPVLYWQLLPTCSGSLISAVLFLATLPAYGQDAPACGQPLSADASYKTIPVYSNGPDQQSTTACDKQKKYFPYGMFGSQFQCTEYVKRFYYESLKDKHAINWTGDAIDYFASANTDLPALGANNKMLIPYQNRGQTGPAPDDILVLALTNPPDTEGHVAIITSVTEDTVTLIEQNWSFSGFHTLPMAKICSNGTCAYEVSDRISYPADHPEGIAWTVTGWLRLPPIPPNLTTVQFTGTITFVGDQYNFLPPGLVIEGNSLSGSFTYDPTVPNSSNNPNVGEYVQTSPNTSMVMTIFASNGPLTFVTPSPPPQYSLNTVLGQQSAVFASSFNVLAPVAFPNLDSVNGIGIGLALANQPGQPPFLSSIALPNNWSTLSLSQNQEPGVGSGVTGIGSSNIHTGIGWFIDYYINTLTQLQ